MAHLGASDVLAMLADLEASGGGVEVTVGAQTTVGLLDDDAAAALDGEMAGIVNADLAVHVVTGALSALATGCEVTVDGESYKAMQILKYGDGALTRIALRVAS